MSDLYALESFLDSGMAVSLIQLIVSPLFSIALYVLSSLGLYTIAQRRGLNSPWLAWIPVARVWLLGSLSDQYRYVTRRQTSSRRKILLVLDLISLVLKVIIVVCLISLVGQAIAAVVAFYSEEQLLSTLFSTLIGLLGLLVPLAAVSIAYTIIRFMALYDVYKSLDPSNCTLFLVLSILFPVTEPFFLLCNRKKDLGMPPRRPEPVGSPFPGQDPMNDPSQQDFWDL